jgi:hypothetical protein
MRRMHVVAATIAVALTTVLTIGGCSASAGPKPHGGTGAASTAATLTGTPAIGGAVRLTAYTDNDGPNATVVLTGAIGDFGTAVSVNSNGTPDAEHTSQWDLRLAHGSFRLAIADLDHHFVAAMRTFPPHRASCSGTVTVSAPAAIVANSGTGAYHGIAGTFALTLELDEVDTGAGCATFGAQSIVISGNATVTIG